MDNVVKALRDGNSETPLTGRILVSPKEMKTNPDVPQAVWDKFVLLPSQVRPQRGAKPAIRLTALAHELASDIRNTVEIAKACNFSLDELKYEYPGELTTGGRTLQEEVEYLVRKD